MTYSGKSKNDGTADGKGCQGYQFSGDERLVKANYKSSSAAQGCLISRNGIQRDACTNQQKDHHEDGHLHGCGRSLEYVQLKPGKDFPQHDIHPFTL